MKIFSLSDGTIITIITIMAYIISSLFEEITALYFGIPNYFYATDWPRMVERTSLALLFIIIYLFLNDIILELFAPEPRYKKWFWLSASISLILLIAILWFSLKSAELPAYLLFSFGLGFIGFLIVISGVMTLFRPKSEWFNLQAGHERISYRRLTDLRTVVAITSVSTMQRLQNMLILLTCSLLATSAAFYFLVISASSFYFIEKDGAKYIVLVANGDNFVTKRYITSSNSLSSDVFIFNLSSANYFMLRPISLENLKIAYK